jgi:hypothetical protein
MNKITSSDRVSCSVFWFVTVEYEGTRLIVTLLYLLEFGVNVLSLISFKLAERMPMSHGGGEPGGGSFIGDFERPTKEGSANGASLCGSSARGTWRICIE